MPARKSAPRTIWSGADARSPHIVVSSLELIAAESLGGARRSRVGGRRCAAAAGDRLGRLGTRGSAEGGRRPALCHNRRARKGQPMKLVVEIIDPTK